MKSTIDFDMTFDDNHVMHIKPKELPNWYGIEDIGFVWHGEWADPEIEYKGKRFSCYIIEDTMWYDYTHDDEDNEIPTEMCPEDEFGEWMRQNADVVRNLCNEYLFG